MRHYRFNRALPGSRGERFETCEMFGGDTGQLRAMLDEGWLPAIEGGTTDSFTSGGTWTCPAGVTSADVECFGGGGGGGAGSIFSNGGAGGGGGAYSKTTGVSVTPSTGYAIGVGAGGTAAASSNGGAGGDSTFATTTVVAKGGGGGGKAPSGTGGTGGASASGTGATKFSGGNGANASAGEAGSGGGSSAGTGANGNNGSLGSGSGGAGGTAPTGGFAGGSGGAAAVGNQAPNANGGGAGGGGGSSGGDLAGGAGRPGLVTVTYVAVTAKTGSDSGTESESSSLARSNALTDSSTESESSSLARSNALTDTAAFSEAAVVTDLGTPKTASDSATESESSSLAAAITASQAVALMEAAALAVSASRSDSATVGESAVVVIEPDTIITAGPAEGSLDTDRTPTFAFDSGDAWDNFEYRVDGGSWTALGAGIQNVTLSTLSLGGHVFDVRAVRSGHADATPASRAWVVDLVRPGISIRRPEVPTWLEIELEDASGRKVRSGHEERADRQPSGITHASALPGGFTQSGFSLPRDLRRAYHDLGLLRSVRIYGPLGTVHEGRISDVPGSGGGAQSSLSVETEGYWRHLADDASFLEILVDRDLQSWRGLSEARTVALLNNGNDPHDGSVQWIGDPDDPTLGQSAIVMTHDGAARQASPIVEAWYDAGSLTPAKLYYDYAPLPNAGGDSTRIESDTNFNAYTGNAADEALNGVWSRGSDLGGYSGAAGYMTFANLRRYLFLQYSWELTTWIHTLGYQFSIRWAKLAVYGNHGLTLYGSDPKGVLGSDVIALAVARQAPMLTFSTGAGGSIEPSTFVIPHLKFTEPSTAEAVILAVTSLGGADNRANDWGVFDSPSGPEFFWKSPGSYGRRWRVRTGATTTLQFEGPQIADAINGVVVQWQSADGKTHYIGPTGSGLEAESALLLDADPENPANQISGLRRWPVLSIGTTTYAIAEQVGALFLNEAKQRKMSGDVSHVGLIEDDRGVLHPPSMVRAGDEVEILNLPDRGPYRIIGASHSQDGLSVSMSLDAPPARLDVMLERFQAGLSAAGL